MWWIKECRLKPVLKEIHQFFVNSLEKYPRMKIKGKTYFVQEVSGSNSLKYLFFSDGINPIIKAIAYDYVQDLDKTPVYNLGFGDYNVETEEIDDSANSNNGDMHAVFYTVLSTVPMFFNIHPNAIMAVEGSDHSKEFEESCRISCKKDCKIECKNLNRRIKTYRYFVDKNYTDLVKEYTFLGGTRSENNVVIHEDYVVGKEYDLVFCKRNIPL